MPRIGQGWLARKRVITANASILYVRVRRKQGQISKGGFMEEHKVVIEQDLMRRVVVGVLMNQMLIMRIFSKSLKNATPTSESLEVMRDIQSQMVTTKDLLDELED